MFEFLAKIADEHEKLKKRIHSFRIPLSPTGQRIMSVVYFSIPVIGGYFIMQAAISKSVGNLEKFNRNKVDEEKGINVVQVKEQNQALQKVLEAHKPK